MIHNNEDDQNEQNNQINTNNPNQNQQDTGFFDFIMDFVRAEIRKPEMKEEVLRPLIKWVLWNLMPYAFLFIGLNFFFTMLAVLMVMLFIKQKA
jgi:hypothetical protein